MTRTKRQKSLRSHAWVMAVALLAACQTFSFSSTPRPNPLDPSQLHGSPDQGVIVFSTGASAPCAASKVYLGIFPARAVDEGDRSIVAVANVSASEIATDFPSHPGNLHALALAPGSYYLASEDASDQSWRQVIPKLPFDVAAGEIVYLGEYFAADPCSNRSPVIRDQSARDFALLHERNPEIPVDRIRKRLVRVKGYVGVSDP
ncbi:MAG TPA: hypothetical protein VMR50_03025 [Myxococcota bacterium]|nr:hypothetical protein [Myxococcota bacterium]